MSEIPINDVSWYNYLYTYKVELTVSVIVLMI